MKGGSSAGSAASPAPSESKNCSRPPALALGWAAVGLGERLPSCAALVCPDQWSLDAYTG